MPTMLRIDKFTLDRLQRQSKYFEFLWANAKEIKLESGVFSDWVYIDDPSNFESTLDHMMKLIEEINKEYK